MKTDFVLPRINVNDNDVEVVKWLAKDGDQVEKGGDLVEVSTSKATVILESPASGFVKCHFAKGDVVSVGKVIASIFDTLAEAQAYKPVSAVEAPQAAVQQSISAGGGQTISIVAAQASFGFNRISKKAQAFIAENKIDPKTLEGRGLVSVRSLMGKMKPAACAVPAEAAMPAPNRSQPTFPTETTDVPPDPSLRSEKLDKIKKLEISALTAGQSGNINSSLTVQFNSDKIRSTLKSLNSLNGQMLPLMLYELSRLLESNPLFTSFYYKDKVYFYDRINIGVAIDLGEGLRVGVIKDANKMMPIDIYRALTDYAMKYMKGKLSVEEVTGGTITVTDLSGDDILHFQPLVNQNQTIIIGFGADSKFPGYPMTITGVFDHRVLTGREVSVFLTELKRRILTYESDNFSNLK